MKSISIKLVILFFSVSMFSCILEDPEPEYSVVGGVATITVWTPSKTNPTAGETITIRANYYSEHAPVTQLRFSARVGAGTTSVVETVSISDFNTANSYERTFNYTVPPGTPAGTVIVLTLEVETPNSLVVSRPTPSSGTGTIRVI